jgi:hypothetical protein
MAYIYKEQQTFDGGISFIYMFALPEWMACVDAPNGLLSIHVKYTTTSPNTHTRYTNAKSLLDPKSRKEE